MERLTIDEVIMREKRIHEENQKVVDTHVLHEEFTLEELYCDDTEVIEEHLSNYKFASEYHKQLAEWLEELKSYKDAEENGLLIRLPCPIGGTVWGFEYPTIVKEDGLEYTVCDIRRAKVVPKEFILIMLGRIGTSYFLTREEAEQALAEMQKG